MKRYSQLIAFTLLWLVCMYYSAWYAENPDTFQYLSIAQKYASGNISLAINGYWSPLISWLIAPFLLTGLHPILSFKLIQFLLAVYGLHCWNRLVTLCISEKLYASWLKWMAVPFMLSFSLLNLTPDLLFLVCMLQLLRLAMKADWLMSFDSVIKTALTGALLFFSKAFGFPFFIAFVLVLAVRGRRMKKSAHLFRNYFFSTGLFLMVSLIWILPLSLRYGRPTISRSVSFNLSREVAPLPGRTVQLPVLSGGLIAPSGEQSASAWESPGDAIPVHTMHPLQSADDAKYYTGVLNRNLLTIWYYDFRNQAGLFFLLSIAGLLVSRRRKELMSDEKLFIPLLVVVLVYGGYSLILVHTRYVWICTLLMLLLIFRIAGILFPHTVHSVWMRILLGVVLLLAVKRPVKEIFFIQDKDIPLQWIWKAVRNPLTTLDIMYRPDRQLHEISLEMKAKNIRGTAIASGRVDEFPRDSYTAALYLSYCSGNRYFGQTTFDSGTSTETDPLGIQYYISFSKDKTQAGWIPVIWDEKYPCTVFKRDNEKGE
ncbi:MAG: hypothetical protein IT242_10550 [Bacteroidia bacterium]|nr:hypothetical protein [Bacteroidia bacterium]